MGTSHRESKMRLLLLLAIFFAALTVSSGLPLPQRGRGFGRGRGRGPPGRRPPPPGGGLGVVLTTTIMGSPDPLVGIWEQWQQQVLLVLRAVWLLNLQQTSLAASLDEMEIVLFEVAKCQIHTRH